MCDVQVGSTAKYVCKISVDLVKTLLKKLGYSKDRCLLCKMSKENLPGIVRIIDKVKLSLYNRSKLTFQESKD